MYLKEKSYYVRDLGIKKLIVLVQTFKQEWVDKHLLPKIKEALLKDNSYLIRITALYSLQSVSLVLSAEYSRDKLIPMLLQNGKDPVPNIKLVLCKILKSLGKKYPEQTVF